MSLPHTPGPWSVFEPHTEEAERVVSVLGPDPSDLRKLRPLLAQIRVGPNATGNARLMAAAPTMLAALRGMLTVFAGDTGALMDRAEWQAVQAAERAVRLAEEGEHV